jgi:hypothetical protein
VLHHLDDGVHEDAPLGDVVDEPRTSGALRRGARPRRNTSRVAKSPISQTISASQSAGTADSHDTAGGYGQ